VLHGSGAEFGQVVAAQAVGGVTAGLLVARAARGRSTRWLMGTGAVVFGALDLALFLYPLLYVSVVPAIALMVVIGLPGALVSAGVTTLLQTATPDTHRGRVLGARGALAGAGMLVGIGIASTLGDPVGIIPVIALQGAGYVLGGLWLMTRLPRDDVDAVAPGALAPA
jgi:MFS family permease